VACTCDWREPEDYVPGEWYCYLPRGYVTLKTRVRKKCVSCGERIEVGATVAKIVNYRVPRDDVEAEEDKRLADRYLCETCADLYFSLEEAGACPNLYENQRGELADYLENIAAR
jgi:predicted RNA-binding Zn-ribbon protein involved in translation (DUF1610 family)